jgi:hypothetical protein
MQRSIFPMDSQGPNPPAGTGRSRAEGSPRKKGSTPVEKRRPVVPTTCPSPNRRRSPMTSMRSNGDRIKRFRELKAP